MAQALELSLRSYAPQTLRHSHAHHQVVLPVAGVLEIEIAGKGGRVAGCQAALIAAGRDHSCEASGANSFVVLDWMADDRDDDIARLSDLAERRPFLAYDPGLQHLVSFLGCELRDRPAAARHGWAALLLSTLAARGDAAPLAPSRRMGRAVAYIHANPHRRLSIDEIARAACCSASHLHMLFQRHLGTSPMDYAAECRLDRAMSLLIAGDQPISTIALETGHADQSVLTRSMKRRRGITPAEYRRRARPVSGRA